MSNKVHDFGSGDVGFHCPGCGYAHSFRIKGDGTRPLWKWNGSLDKPTFTPSLAVNRSFPGQECHLNMTDGMIQFHQDCFHNLKGQLIECPDW